LRSRNCRAHPVWEECSTLEPGRGAGPCQPRQPPAVAASRSTLARDAGRRGAACRSRMRRRRRHPEHSAIDPAATHAHRHRGHRARLRPRPVRRVIPLPGAGCVTVADGVLWVLDASGTVVRIDPATNAAVGEPLRVPAHAEAIAVGDGRCGSPASPQGDLGAPREDAVTRVDLPASRTVATITVRRAPWTSRRPQGPSG
jgi:hypothetical protein